MEPPRGIHDGTMHACLGKITLRKEKQYVHGCIVFIQFIKVGIWKEFFFSIAMWILFFFCAISPTPCPSASRSMMCGLTATAVAANERVLGRPSREDVYKVRVVIGAALRLHV